MTFPVLTTSLALLRQVASGVSVGQLDNLTPCSDWTVAQVLLHAAGDQHAWASSISSSPPPAYNPFAPAKQLDGTIDDLIAPAIQTATTAWAGIEGQPAPLTAELAGQLQAAAEATAEPLRGFAYASALPRQATDDPGATLLRYLGRDPGWTP